MKFLIKFLVTLSLSTLAFAVQAQAPFGHMESPQYSGPGEGVFDFAINHYSEDFANQDGDEVQVAMDIIAAADSGGKIMSQGSAMIHIGSGGGQPVDFPGTYKMSGSLKSAGTVARFNGKVTVSGMAFLEGEDRKVKMSVTYNLALDPVSLTVTGTRSGTATASGLGSIRVSDPVMGPTPISQTEAFFFRSWFLAMDLTANNKKVTGVGAALVEGGHNFPAMIKGSYKPQTGVSKLSVSGTGTGKGVKLTVNMTGNHITSVTGSVLGQKVNAN